MNEQKYLYIQIQKYQMQIRIHSIIYWHYKVILGDSALLTLSYSAYVDDFRIYDRKLTGQEIRCLSDSCDFKCNTCSIQSDLCLSCNNSGIRDINQNCKCSPSTLYYGDSSSSVCSDNLRNNCNVIPDDFIVQGINSVYNQGQSHIQSTGPVNDILIDLTTSKYGMLKDTTEIGAEFTISFWLLINDNIIYQRILTLGNFTLQDSNYHHYVIQADLLGSITFYLDGIIQVTQIIENTYVGQIEKTQRNLGFLGWGIEPGLLYWGQSIDSGAYTTYYYPLSGRLSEFLIYERIISENEILCLSDQCPYACIGCQIDNDQNHELNCLDCETTTNPRIQDQHCICPISTNPVREIDTCECPTNYGTFTNTTQCLSCQNNLCANCNETGCIQCIDNGLNRQLENDCQCPINYFDNYPTDNDCYQCAYEGCETCSSISGSCLTCRGVQGFQGQRETPTCECPQGYYSDLDNYESCQKCDDGCFECELQGAVLVCTTECDDQCETCSGTADNCQACEANRENPPSCECIEGYYSNSSNICVLCQETCDECGGSSCLQCHGNRQDDDQDGICDCPSGGIDHYATDNIFDCTTCEFGVYTTQLSDDYFSITIQFYIDQIHFPDLETDSSILSTTLCTYVIQNESLQKLGDSPKCQLNTNQILIQLGRGKNVQIGDDILLKSGIIQFKDSSCMTGNKYFQSFSQSADVKLPSDPEDVIVSLKGPNNKPSICKQNVIQIGEIIGNGNLELSNFYWSLENASLVLDDYIELLSVITQMNELNSNVLTIPPLTLKENTIYEFKLIYTNYWGIQGECQYTLETGTALGLVSEIDIQSDLIYNNWEINFILGTFGYLECSNGNINYIDKEINVEWIDVSDNNQQNILEQFSSKIGQRQPLYINAIAKDINLNLEEQFKNIDITWTCQNLLTQNACEDVQGNLITLNNNQNITFIEKTFTPYSYLQFGLSAQQSISPYKFNDDSILIIITENDAPIITVELPDLIHLKSININDYIMAVITSDTVLENPTYSLAIVYQYNIVSVKQFNYNEYNFKIWDLFSDFTPDNTQVTLRFSMYDPYYFSPAVVSINIDINLPPVGGQIQVQPVQGISLSTLFTIQINNFYDENQPLTYKYQIYLSEDLYEQDKMQGQMINLDNVVLSDFITSNNIQTYLPHGNNQIIVMVSITDSLGAIQNITQTIQVNEQNNNNILSDAIQNMSDFYELILENEQDQQYFVRQLNILCQELNQIEITNMKYSTQDIQKLMEFKQLLYYKLLEYDDIEVVKFISVLNQIKISLQIVLKQIDGQTIELDQNQIKNRLSSLIIETQDKYENIKEIILQNSLYSGDHFITQKIDNIKLYTGKTFSYIDQLLINSYFNEKYKERRFLQTSNQSDDIENLQFNIQELISLLQITLLPNFDSQYYKGEQMKLQIDKGTLKNIDELYFLSQSIQREDFTSQDEQNSEYFDQSSNAESKIYRASYLSYQNNPYMVHDSFPYQDQQQQGQQIIIQNENQSQNDISVEQITLSKKNQFNFDDNEDEDEDNKEKDVCIQKIEENWSAANCETITSYNTDGSQYKTCQCDNISFTTIVTDIKNIFTSSTVVNAFTKSAVSDLFNFQFYEASVFYIFVLELFLLIVGLKYTYKIDKARNYFQVVRNLDTIKKVERKLKKKTKLLQKQNLMMAKLGHSSKGKNSSSGNETQTSQEKDKENNKNAAGPSTFYQDDQFTTAHNRLNTLCSPQNKMPTIKLNNTYNFAEQKIFGSNTTLALENQDLMDDDTNSKTNQQKNNSQHKDSQEDKKDKNQSYDTNNQSSIVPSYRQFDLTNKQNKKQQIELNQEFSLRENHNETNNETNMSLAINQNLQDEMACKSINSQQQNDQFSSLKKKSFVTMKRNSILNSFNLDPNQNYLKTNISQIDSDTLSNNSKMNYLTIENQQQQTMSLSKQRSQKKPRNSNKNLTTNINQAKNNQIDLLKQNGKKTYNFKAKYQNMMNQGQLKNRLSQKFSLGVQLIQEAQQLEEISPDKVQHEQRIDKLSIDISPNKQLQNAQQSSQNQLYDLDSFSIYSKGQQKDIFLQNGNQFHSFSDIQDATINQSFQVQNQQQHQPYQIKKKSLDNSPSSSKLSSFQNSFEINQNNISHNNSIIIKEQPRYRKTVLSKFNKNTDENHSKPLKMLQKISEKSIQDKSQKIIEDNDIKLNGDTVITQQISPERDISSLKSTQGFFSQKSSKQLTIQKIEKEYNAQDLKNIKKELIKGKEADQNQNQELLPKDIMRGLIFFHPLVGIFYREHIKISSSARLLLYYLKAIAPMAFTAMAVSTMTQIQTILFTLTISMFTDIPLFIVQFFLKKKQGFIRNVIGLVLYLLFGIVILYICLVNAASMELKDSNQWAVDYTFSVLLDIFMVQVLKTMCTLIFINWIVIKKESKFKKLMMRIFRQYVPYFQGNLK
ncbi:Insulin-like growth factor binding protein, N-terminal [Pseudocohnilembus persalinus]|uniref:Insulin-like growth factor binding protein, N-terminal n=1 Tax=Pseudocohnilembus persalinus TaxID=266149 RepID=A0A0V0QV05_PSEPJ|nr:Insulin-like growth factor binding protein, N-terminal [Pseudocohnilembus persalinus]|eukprot:KRX06046.1 Insulin-like growth factor binding protein, N-terminal [Pseudocohnilembus persalinus]